MRSRERLQRHRLQLPATDLVPLQRVQEHDRQANLNTCHGQAFPTSVSHSLVVHQVVHDPFGRRPVSPQQVAGPLRIRLHPSSMPFQVLPVYIDAKHPRVLPTVSSASLGLSKFLLCRGRKSPARSGRAGVDSARIAPGSWDTGLVFLSAGSADTRHWDQVSQSLGPISKEILGGEARFRSDLENPTRFPRRAVPLASAWSRVSSARARGLLRTPSRLVDRMCTHVPVVACTLLLDSCSPCHDGHLLRAVSALPPTRPAGL
jgi:hypothetical protein